MVLPPKKVCKIVDCMSTSTKTNKFKNPDKRLGICGACKTLTFAFCADCVGWGCQKLRQLASIPKCRLYNSNNVPGCTCSHVSKTMFRLKNRRLVPVHELSSTSPSSLTQAPLETVKSFDEATKTHSRVQQLYRVFNQISDGADGGVHGFGGSLTPMSLSLTLEKLQVEGKSFVDLGAGDGRVALSAVKIFNATYACG
jgi:hypothetical protein